MEDTYERWVQEIRSGDHRAVARAISAVESGDPVGVGLLKCLFPKNCQEAYVLGVTGPPGAGKSTLVEKLVIACRRRNNRVGVLAVDPTSPFSGGAFLGDRIRMQSLSNDEAVYIRSMATRGRLGGVAVAAADAVAVFQAAGCEVVLVETVGVGQDETDIRSIADATLLVVAPEIGDGIQVLKAGVMEIADLFVINKADLPGAGRLEEYLRALTSTARQDGWDPPVLQTIATTGEGVEQLTKAIDAFHAYCRTNSLCGRRQRERWRLRLLEIVRQNLFDRWAQVRLADGSVSAFAERIANGEQDPYSAAEELTRDFFTGPSGH